MSIIYLSAAGGASLCWAIGAMVAHRPATLLGAFEFTRTQLISSSAVLLCLVTALDDWRSVTWEHWASFTVASLVGVVLTNLAMVSCLRRGGPRRTQLLVAMNAPIAAILGYGFLGEVMSTQKFYGAALAFAGLLLAILFGRRTEESRLEVLQGSLAVVVVLGLVAATCKAVGLIALKPALLAGTSPLAASALRTGGAALVLSVIALWPAEVFDPLTKRTPGLVIHAIVPGFLGYVAAVSLQLYALQGYDTGIVAVLSSAAPVFILPLQWVTTHVRPPTPAWFGAGLTLVGTGLILYG
ncbi:MAG: DMT family transporter [Rhodospirillales bacterium]|nr:DMT family transporter [Rhodospirillales bacterium]